MKKTAFRITPLLLALALMCTGCGSLLADAGKLAEYELSGDRIPSVTSVAGVREVTSVNTATENGAITKTYAYVSDSVFDDLWAYVQFLMDEGWLVTEDIELSTVPGTGQLGKTSSDEGKILLVSFSYDEGSYVIEVKKTTGTIG